MNDLPADLVIGSVRALPEPRLTFRPDGSALHTHPLRGLIAYGPFSSSWFAGFKRAVRVALVAPAGDMGRLRGVIAELNQRHAPRERRQYLIDFPGFAEAFRIPLEVAPATCHVELTLTQQHLDVSRSAGPLVLDHVSSAITALRAQRAEFDVVLVLLPARWQAAYGVPGSQDTRLHDRIKAFAAQIGVPTQVVREDSALAYFCRCSVAWRLSIAIYVKAGGVPWRLADLAPDCAFIGLGYALRRDEADNPVFVTCCSQVFDADGTGLEFLAYKAPATVESARNPFLPRDHMRTLMSRSLQLYQERHAGRIPRRLVVHKKTPFKQEEIDGVIDAWGHTDVELLTLERSEWRGVRLTERSKPDQYPMHRGSSLVLGRDELLLWVQGNSPGAVSGTNYFPQGRGIPWPLSIKRFLGVSDEVEICREILGLTKMDWNSDALYQSDPVTLGYADRLAQLVAECPDLLDRPYPFSLFM